MRVEEIVNLVPEILAGVGMLACFPIAYGIVLPGLYLPTLLMLMALGARGVSFEFVAALCQGLMLGALVDGVSVDGKNFDGSVLDVLSPFAAIRKSGGSARTLLRSTMRPSRNEAPSAETSEWMGLTRYQLPPFM